MTELTARNIYDLELIILDYLQGEPIDVIRVRLQSQCSQLDASCQSLYKSIKLEAAHNIEVIEEEDDLELPVDERTDEEDCPTIRLTQSILASLNIKKSNDPTIQGTYEKVLSKSKNLYDVIKILSDDGHEHAEYLLGELIKKIKPRRNWTLIFLLSSVVSAALGGLTYYHRQHLAAIGQWFSSTFPVVVSWLAKTFSILRNIPLLGIIGNGVVLIWNWYNALSNGTTIPTRKLHNLLFKTLATGLTISAYTFSFLAAGTITIGAAILFVLSSTTKVFQGGYNWWKNSRPIKPEDTEEWEVLAQYERANNLHQRSKYSALVNIGAAMFTTIAVAIWNIFPPSLVVTVFCVSFISLITLTEWSILSSINESAAYRLQMALEKIDCPKSTLVRPPDQNQASRLHDRYEQLITREARLRDKEEAIARREGEVNALLRDISTGFTGFSNSTLRMMERLHSLQRGAAPESQTHSFTFHSANEEIGHHDSPLGSNPLTLSRSGTTNEDEGADDAYSHTH